MELGPIFRSIRRNKSRFALILLEVALTLAVITNCVTLIAEARRQMTHPSGFDDVHMIAIESTPLDVKFKEQTYADQALARDLALLRATPGVRAASHTEFLPWAGGGRGMLYGIAGEAPLMLDAQAHAADAAIIEATGAQLVEGRTFSVEEVTRASQGWLELQQHPRAHTSNGRVQEQFKVSVIVTRAYAERLFGPGPYVGKLLTDSEGDLYEIVGVIGPFYSPYRGDHDPRPDQAVLIGFSTAEYAGSTYLVRGSADSGPELLGRLEAALLQENPLRSLRIRPVDSVRSAFFGQQTLLSTMLSAVSVLLVLVTSLGIVGLTSFSVTARTKQIGVRRALGAKRGDIVRYFLTENWVVTTLGLVVGGVAAYGLNMGLMNLVNAGRLPLTAVLGVGLGLCVTNSVATLWPALRGARISPSVATRNV